MDADLEADLGIDSIKKAQLFGELGERFQIAPPTGNVTLDDFSTLRHVYDFIATVCRALGLDPTKQNQSNVGRPIRLADAGARPIAEVLA